MPDLINAGVNPIAARAVEVPSHEAINAHNDEKREMAAKEGGLDFEIQEARVSGSDAPDKDTDNEAIVIRTGEDASKHLLPMRDDFDPCLTFRGIFLATCLSAFQAVMKQIYTVSPTRLHLSVLFDRVCQSCVESLF